MKPSYYVDGLFRQSNAADARSYLGITAGGAVNFSAGTTSQNLAAVTFANSNGVTFGLDAALSQITASVGPGGGGLTNINLSAGTTSNNLSAFTLANSNGVSFGLNGSVVTATVATNYQSQGAYLTTAMASNRGSDFVQATAAFFGTNASGTIASDAISVSVAAPSAASINLSAGTTSNNLTAFTLSNSNNVSFGLNGSVVTASATVASTQASIGLSAGTQSILSSQFTFADSNGVSFGMSNGVITATVQTNYLTAGLTNLVVAAGGSTNSVSEIVFADSNGVSFGLNGSTITASASAGTAAGPTMSYFNALEYLTALLTGFSIFSNTSLVAPFQLPWNASFGFLRFPFSFVMAAPASYATSVNQTTYSFCQTCQTNVVIYSLGTGASSNSLMSVASGSGGMTVSFQLSESGANYTQGTSVTYPISGTVSQFSSTTSTNRTNVSWTSSGMNSFVSNRYVDVPFSNSLSPGPYWLAIGVNSSTATQGNGTLSTMMLGHSLMAISQANSTIQEFVATTNSPFPLAEGRITSAAAGGTFANINIAAISTTQAHPLVYWQGMNRA